MRIAAAALASAVMAPWPGGSPAAPDPLAQADLEAAAVEAQLQELERSGVGADEPAVHRAERRRKAGERQYVLGDWHGAAILLTQAVDEPAWRGAPERASALFRLADALRREGLCGAARVRFSEYLDLGHEEHRGAAVSGALECAAKGGLEDDVKRLLVEAEQVFGDDPPPEVRYIAAKSLFHRTDLPEAERIARARDAFSQVGPPFQLQAWYFLGVLGIQEGNLDDDAIPWFTPCAWSEPRGERDVEIRDLCRLALGRVYAHMGDSTAALSAYRAVTWESPRLVEALHEAAETHAREKQLDQALSMATFVAGVAPDSPQAPDATLLRGRLLLWLGRHDEATEAFDAVIDSYAPVRDEITAILSMQEDPVRAFDELVGRGEKDIDPAAVLPPVAARWAARDEEVALALGLVKELDEARREVRQARQLSDRMAALLERGGLDASPRLRRATAQAHAVENAAARAEAAYVAALGVAAKRALGPERRAELDRARRARADVEARFERLPRTSRQVEERLARMRRRIGAVEREAFRLGFAVRGCMAAIGGTEDHVEQRGPEIGADAAARRELMDELRKQRAVVEGYEAELAALSQDAARVRDAAGGADAMEEESRLRAQYLGALEREWLAVDAARARVSSGERSLFERVDAARGRLRALRSRARVLEEGALAEATRRASELRARLDADRLALAAHDEMLDGVQAVSKDLLGRIALRALAQVGDRFHGLVLQADVGLVDAAWSRKRERLDRVQQLAVQKDAALDQLDREYRSVLREED